MSRIELELSKIVHSDIIIFLLHAFHYPVSPGPVEHHIARNARDQRRDEYRELIGVRELVGVVIRERIYKKTHRKADASKYAKAVKLGHIAVFW